MPSKLDSDATVVPMGINDNTKLTIETNKNEVHDEQHATVPAKNNFSYGRTNDHSTFYNSTARSSTSNSNSFTIVTYHRKNIVTITILSISKRYNFSKRVN